MVQRGRKSNAARGVVVQGNFGNKAEVPAGLTPEQAAIWRETVASEAQDVFGTAVTKALLKDYCRARAEADRLSAVIDSFATEWLRNAEGCKRYADLTKTREKEARAARDAARSLRLTNQSRYTPGAASTAARKALKTKMPWDLDEEA